MYIYLSEPSRSRCKPAYFLKFLFMKSLPACNIPYYLSPHVGGPYISLSLSPVGYWAQDNDFEAGLYYVGIGSVLGGTRFFLILSKACL